jgi:hypothetical protein
VKLSHMGQFSLPNWLQLNKRNESHCREPAGRLQGSQMLLL